MAIYDGALSVNTGSYTLRLTATETSLDEPNNRSKVAWELKIIRNSGAAFNNDATSSWSAVVNGVTVGSGPTAYNFGAYSELVLGSGTSDFITHNSDGSKSVSVSGSFSGPGPITGGSTGGTLALTTFNVAPGKRWSGSAWVDVTTAKRWTGSAWTNLTIKKRWSGSAWVDLS